MSTSWGPTPSARRPSLTSRPTAPAGSSTRRPAAGITGTIGQANYGAAKAAIIGLTKSLARELASSAITANVIAPLAATKMTEVVRTDPRFAEQSLARVPLKRWAEPEEIAGSFAFLASDDAGYITGQVLCVDGGLII